MKPNSMEFFYYPNTKNSEKPDPYQIFMLIRLPEWMGGDATDASAYRAYSALGIDDHCMVRYWPEDGRQRIENPCSGVMYRSIDGAMTRGFDLKSVRPIALPQLNLSSDENGFLYIEPPTWSKTKNGVNGYGREISLEEIVQSSEFLKEKFTKSNPDFPKVSSEFAGFTLSEIDRVNQGIVILYADFTSTSGYLFISIQKCYCQEPTTINLTEPNSEFWQIGDTVLTIGGSALDKNNEMPEQFKVYEIQFIKDGYEFRIEGKNIDFMKKEIVANYFPEYKYDDMFLISKND
jgi:hypothetical protein